MDTPNPQDIGQGIANFLSDLLSFSPELRDKIIGSVAIIVVLLLVRWLTMRIVVRRSDNIKTIYRWRKATTYVTSLLLLFLVGRLWFDGVKSIGTFLGLLSAGVAIALRDPLVNFAGWIFIMWRKPFEVGDRIQIGDYRGDVIDLRIFQFTLMEIGNWVDADQSTGRVIHVPNGFVFSKMQANYSKGFQFLWNEIGVLITFESNWTRAEELLSDIVTEHAEHLTERAQVSVRKAARRYMIHYGTLTPRVYVKVKDSGVMLTMRYLCLPRNRRNTEERIWKDVLRAFAAHDDIDFAYPTIRTYRNDREGKLGTRPPDAGAERPGGSPGDGIL